MEKDRISRIFEKTADAPYLIGRSAFHGIAYTLKAAYVLFKNIFRIPGALNYLRYRTDEYQNNLKTKNEDFMEDIEKGRFVLGQARAGLLGVDMNYSRARDGKTPLHLAVIHNNKLLQKYILQNQSDFSNPRIGLKQADMSGNDALFHCVRTNQVDSTAFLLKYPFKLLQNVQADYFAGSNKLFMTKKVEKRLEEEIAKSYGLDLNHRDGAGKTALMLAAQKSDGKIFSALMEASRLYGWKFDPNLKDETGKNLLHYAAIGGNLHGLAALELYQIPVNKNQKDERGKTPGDYAWELGHKDFYKKLQLWNPQYPNREKEFAGGAQISGCPKGMASTQSIGQIRENMPQLAPPGVKGFGEFLDLDPLKKTGPVTWVKDKLTKAAFDRVMKEYNQNSEYWEERLSKAGEFPQMMVSIYRTYKDKDEILLRSLRRSSLEKNLMTAVTDINYQGRDDGKTALMIAAESANDDKMRWVLEQSSTGSRELNLTKQDHQGNTALMLAAEHGYLRGAKEILAYKFHAIGALRRKFYPVSGMDGHLTENQVKSIQMEGKAMINQQNLKGENALMIALKNGNYRIAHIIFAHCREMDIPIEILQKSKNGDHLLGLAITKGDYPSVKEILAREESRVAANMANGQGKTPLELAVASNAKSMVEILAAHGGDVHKKSKDGKTLLDIALENNSDPGLRRYLKKLGIQGTGSVEKRVGRDKNFAENSMVRKENHPSLEERTMG